MSESNQHSELLRDALLDAEYRTLGRVAADKRRTDALAALDGLLEQLEALRGFWESEGGPPLDSWMPSESVKEPDA